MARYVYNNMCGCASRTVVVESFRKHWNPMRPTGSLNPGNLRRIAGNLARRDCKPLPFLAQESIHQERSCSHCYSSATLELLINVQPHVPCDHLSPLLWKKKTHTPAAVNSRILPVSECIWDMVEMMRNVRDGKGINHVDQTFEPQFELGLSMSVNQEVFAK